MNENKKSVSVRLISGIGNNFYQIATVYNYAKLNNLNWKCIIPDHNSQIQENRPHGGHYTPKNENDIFFIEDVFPNINWTNCLDKEDEIYTSYDFRLNNFWDSIDELKKILTPNIKITEYINNKYKNIFENKKVLGLHLRFNSGSDSFPPEANINEWIEEIINEEKNNYDNIIILTNRPLFALNVMNGLKNTYQNKNILLIEDESNLVDFILLTKCDIIICSNSTFSFWAGALSNTNNVYIPPEYKPANFRDNYPTHWKTNKETFYKYYIKN